MGVMKQLSQIINIDDLSKLHKEDYPDGFFYWLQFNEHIWLQFERHAHTMAAKRERYSARTIIEVMRWNSDLREKQGKPLFKLSNNMTPGLARLWMAKHGINHTKFFQLNK